MEPILVVMAAGMGSRYGGLKQMDPIDVEGHKIIDFSIYDAKRAGFKKVIFVIKRELEKDFKELVGKPISKYMEVEYAFQELSDLPEGYQVPEGRVKPFGTGHAILSCRSLIKEPFAVINADDYYGVHAFQMIYDYLVRACDDEVYHYTMVGYRLKNTVTDNGYVSRGICEIDKENKLREIIERTRIEKVNGKIMYSLDEGNSYVELQDETVVSMNMWGFTPAFIKELQARFVKFLDEDLRRNPLKAEYFLPFVVDELLQEKKADVKVLNSEDRWYGVTYKEDKESVVQAIESMKRDNLYPKYLWK